MLACLLLLLSGCFQEDEPIQPTAREEMQIPYSLYEYQSYFNLKDRELVAFHPFTDWDLGFECSDTGHRIILNYARFMFSGNVGKVNFDTVQTWKGLTMKFDASSGNTDSTALGDWADFSIPANPIFSGNVYVINRGSDESGNSFGYKKVIFENFQNNIYQFRFANLDGTDDHTFSIAKDTSVNYISFSFDNGGSPVLTEPPKDTWDLCFTKYTTLLYENDTIPTPYLVRGVYLNPMKVSCTTVTNIPFSQFTYNNLDSYTFSTKQDALGFEWKVYEDGIYKIVPDIFYIIKNRNQKVYKMRFTSFNNKEGERGYPSFELEELSF